MLLVILVLFVNFDHVYGFWPCRWFWTSWFFFNLWDLFLWSVIKVQTMLLVILVVFVNFDHVDGFWPCLWFWTSWLISTNLWILICWCFRPMGWLPTSLIGFDQCYGFRRCCWSYWWFLSILTMLMVFDHVDCFEPVDFFDKWDGSWPVWLVLISVMGLD